MIRHETLAVFAALVKDGFRRIHRDEEGQGMTEYILIVVFVAIAILLILGAFRDEIARLFRGTNSELQGVDTAPLSP